MSASKTGAAAQPGRLAALRTVVWAGALVVACLATMAFFTVRIFERAIEPELSKRSLLIAAMVREDLEHALDLGVPIEAIAGSDRYLTRIVATFNEVDLVAIAGRDGTVLAAASRAGAASAPAGTANRLEVPLLRGNLAVATIVVEVTPSFARTRLQDVFLDILVVGLVATLLAFELVIWIVAGAIGKPIDRIHALLSEQSAGRFDHVIPPHQAGLLRRIARRLSDRAIDLAERRRAERPRPLRQSYFSDIRLPLFLFATATEIGGAFLPVYARNAGGPTWLSAEFAAMAPIAAFLVAGVLAAPVAGRIGLRVGPRRLFLAAVPVTALAMVGIGLGQSALSIAFWCGAMAFVTLLATVACVDFIERNAPAGQEARAYGSYLFVLLGGAFSGSALGGVLADRIGEGPTFLAGAVLALLAAALGAATILPTLHGPAPEAVPPASPQPGTGRGVLRDARILALLVGAAAPLSLGLAVFIWYLVPLMLEAQGYRAADIGRVLMVTYFVPLLVGPTAARLADGRLGCAPLIVAGLAISGAGLSAVALAPGYGAVLAAVAAFGLGSALCDVSVRSHVVRIARTHNRPGAATTAIGALRLVENAGALAGLLTSGLAVAAMGYVVTVAGIGTLMLAGAGIVLVAEIGTRLATPAAA